MQNTIWPSNLNKNILNVLQNQKKFEFMTPVQAATLKYFCHNKDVLVRAETGSGKTLAFLVPILDTLMRKCQKPKKNAVLSLVITPTKELACQIHEELEDFLKCPEIPFTSELLVGGVKKEERYRGSNIIVCTPGRLLHELEISFLATSVKQLEVLVLDEADRLFERGFQREITSIFALLPKQRQTGLFSATLEDNVELFKRAGLRNCSKIDVARQKNNSIIRTPLTLVNKFIMCSELNKLNKLFSFIDLHKDEKVVVFFSTCASVDYFGNAIKELIDNNNPVFLLHSKLSKKTSRNAVLKQFRNVEKGVLVCTDVLARGIDIPDIDWVLQYDPPSKPENFLHRSGRTARNGRTGKALMFLLVQEDAYVPYLKESHKVTLDEFKFDNEDNNWLKKLKKLAMSDRAMMDRGITAYVSFIKAYTKHELSSIFQKKYINFGLLATGYALLKMPSMPETKNRKIVGFTPVSPDIIKNIKYKNQLREKQRLEKLKRPAPEPTRPQMYNKKSKAFSKTRLDREERKNKKQQKKMRKEQSKRMKFDEEEEEELRRDAAMVKKEKNRKITKEQYDQSISAAEKDIFHGKPTNCSN